MQKYKVLPNRVDLEAIMVGVDPDPELLSHLYSILLDKLADKEFSKSDIEEIVLIETRTYFYSTSSSEAVGAWLENVAHDIVDELTK